MKTRTSVCLLLLLVLSCCASAEKRKIAVAVGLGLAWPSDSKTKDTFGSDWEGFGVKTFEVSTSSSSRLMADFRAYKLDAEKLDGPVKARLYPLTFGVEQGLGKEGSTRPYVALRAGPYYGHVEEPAQGVDKTLIGLDANVAVGVIFKERFYVEARYDFLSSIGGYDFDGLSVIAGVRVFDIKL